MEPGQEHQQSDQQLWQPVFPPHPLSPPHHLLHCPTVLQKDAEEKEGGLENNICWILNIWMKLTKKLSTHNQVGTTSGLRPSC